MKIFVYVFCLFNVVACTKSITFTADKWKVKCVEKRIEITEECVSLMNLILPKAHANWHMNPANPNSPISAMNPAYNQSSCTNKPVSKTVCVEFKVTRRE